MKKRRKKSAYVEECKLCGEERPLRRSHIIPKFVVRWQKQSGFTPYLRTAEDMNRRTQDSKTARLLCDECEQRLSGWENELANEVFHKAVNDEWVNGYSEETTLAALSIVWRTIWDWMNEEAKRKQLGKMRVEGPKDLVDQAAKKEAEWREQIIRGEVNESEIIHMVIFGETDRPMLEGTESENRYLLRSVEITPMFTSKGDEYYLWIKMGPIAIIAVILKKDGELTEEEWSGTRMLPKGIQDRPKRIVLPMRLKEFMEDRARLHREWLDSISPEERVKIKQSIGVLTTERLQNTGMGRAVLADAARYGWNADGSTTEKIILRGHVVTQWDSIWETPERRRESHDQVVRHVGKWLDGRGTWSLDRERDELRNIIGNVERMLAPTRGNRIGSGYKRTRRENHLVIRESKEGKLEAHWTEQKEGEDKEARDENTTFQMKMWVEIGKIGRKQIEMIGSGLGDMQQTAKENWIKMQEAGTAAEMEEALQHARATTLCTWIMVELVKRLQGTSQDEKPQGTVTSRVVEKAGQGERITEWQEKHPLHEKRKTGRRRKGKRK